MPQRRPIYNTDHEATKASEQTRHAAPSSKVAESGSPAYTIEPAWIDAAKRTRTWALRDPHGTKMAEITTKTAALKLARLLNKVTGDERGPAR